MYTATRRVAEKRAPNVLFRLAGKNRHTTTANGCIASSALIPKCVIYFGYKGLENCLACTEDCTVNSLSCLPALMVHRIIPFTDAP